MSKAQWGGGTLFFLALVANFLPVSDKGRWVLSGLALLGAIVWFMGYMRAKDAKPQQNRPVNILGQISGTFGVAGRDNVQSIHHYHGTPSDKSQSRRFRISCHSDIEGCVKQARFTSEGLLTNFFRVKVEAEGGNIQNCTGFLTRIERNGKSTWGGDSAKLTFAQGEDPDTFSKIIRSNVAQFLDVLAVTSRNEMYPGTFIAPYGRIWPYAIPLTDIFSEPGDYMLTVAVTGDDIPTETAILKFTWTQNWQTTALIKQP